ncbi:hypothetical protein QQ045_023320 [Rhodiola kirilowii]
MKKSDVVVFFTLLCLFLLVVDRVAAREDPLDVWERTVKGEQLPEVIKAMVHSDPKDANARKYHSRIAKDFDTKENAIIYHRRFAKDFDVKPNAIIYHSAQKSKA